MKIKSDLNGVVYYVRVVLFSASFTTVVFRDSGVLRVPVYKRMLIGSKFEVF